MRKTIVLALLTLLAALIVTGCGQSGSSEIEIIVTPALTPLFTAENNTSSVLSQTPQVSGGVKIVSAQTVIIAGAGKTSSQRSPIVMRVPLSQDSVLSSPAPQDAASTPTASAPAATPQPTSSPVENESQAPTPSATLASATTEPAEETTPVAHHGVRVSLDDTLNILVVGSDEQKPGQPWRSDVIMLVAIDYANHQVGVISFPRDLWVTIPTVEDNRINTATFFGGLYNYPNGGDIGLLKDTLAQNFGIRIDHYIKFNFNTFKDIIDALDGIDVTVDCPLTGHFPIEPGSKKLVWKTLEPGLYHMDGELALRYVRERKTTNDVDRNRRQQRVLVAMRKRAQEVNIIPRIPALYDAMRENIDTDLGLTDIIALTRLGLQIDMKDVHGFNIGYKEATSWTTPGGASVLRPNMAKIQEGIDNLFVDKPSLLANSSKKPSFCR